MMTKTKPRASNAVVKVIKRLFVGRRFAVRIPRIAICFEEKSC